MGGDVVAEAFPDGVDQLLETGVLEGRQLAAVLADGVVVVIAAGIGRFVARRAVDVDLADEPELGEDVEGAIDAGEADTAVCGSE